MATQRCRYTPSVRGDPDAGRVTCWRPTFGDSDRCIWHAEGGKSVPELAAYGPEDGERLDGAVLRGLDLRGVQWLAGMVLTGADFSNADVSRADLTGADLRNSRLKDATAHETNFRRANLERSNMREADLRAADLRRTRLNAATLSESRITERTAFGRRVVYEVEMHEASDPRERETALESAIRTYGKIEDLSQENSLSAQASRYYRKSKDVRRRFNWRSRNYLSAVVGEASRWFTGYGNRPWRVILTSLGVILGSAVLYPLVGGLHRPSGRSAVLSSFSNVSDASIGQFAEVLSRSLYFSAVTFTTLGYGNFEPSTMLGRYIASIEALVGTVLLALLVGVLTRSTWLR